MSRTKARFSRTEVRSMWKLLEDLGQQPVSIRFYPDGAFHILTAEHVRIARDDAPDDEPNPWDEVLRT